MGGKGPLPDEPLPEAVEAAAAGQEEDADPKTKEVENETEKIGAALKALRDRERADAELKSDDLMDKLDEAHGQAEERLESAADTTADQVDEAEIKADIKDLKKEYADAAQALDWAKKGDFSYMAALTGGGALEDFYKSEDPLLLNSIRRGDFVTGGDAPKPYVDGQGNEISKENKRALAYKVTDELRDLGKQAKRQMNTLPLLPSHMMGNDKPVDEEEAKANPPIPMEHLDRLCLLCEGLSGSGALSSVPGCEGLSCETGAWTDSDAKNVYDEDDIEPVLHPEQYQAVGEHFSDNAPVYQDGPPEKRKTREEDFLSEEEKSAWPYSKYPNNPPVNAFSPPTYARAALGGPGVEQSLASVPAASEARVAHEACMYLAAKGVPEVVRMKFGGDWLRMHFERRYGVPLRCPAGQQLAQAEDAAGGGGGGPCSCHGAGPQHPRRGPRGQGRGVGRSQRKEGR